MSPPSDGDKVSCYLSSNSLSDDDEVTRLHSQSPKGEDEDHDADDATDGGRRAVTHIEHYNQHDRQGANDDDDDDDAAIEWGWGVMMEDKEVGGWKKTPTEHRPNLSRI